EHLLLYLRRNAGAVVANRDLYAVAEVLGRSRKRRLIAIAIVLLSPLGRRVEGVRDQVQERARVISCLNTSTLPAAGSKDLSMLSLKHHRETTLRDYRRPSEARRVHRNQDSSSAHCDIHC